MTGILTLEQAKAQLRIPDADTSQDAQLQGFVDGITHTVERYKGLVIVPRTITERQRCAGSVSQVLLAQTPVMSLTSIASVDGSSTWDVDAMDVDPDGGCLSVLSGPPLRGYLLFTYTAGMAEIPQDYQQGALVILQHVWETQRGVGGVGMGVIGSEEHYDPRTSYSIPRKALEWLGAPLAGVA